MTTLQRRRKARRRGGIHNGEIADKIRFSVGLKRTGLVWFNRNEMMQILATLEHDHADRRA